MTQSSRIDISIIAFLLVCTSSLLVNGLVLRSFIIAPKEGWSLYTDTDRNQGGASEAAVRSNESPFVMEYVLRDETANPYVTLGIPLEERSFEWFDRIVVRARSIGTDTGRYRIYLRNLEPFSDPGDWSTRRHNESFFETTAEFRDIVIPRKSFKVPTWWLESYILNPEDGVPRFDRTVEISITTGSLSRSESATLEIESIAVQGHWIPPIQLYRILLILWTSGILFIALRRYILAARRMRSSRNRMEKIRDINRTLSRERRKMARIAFTDELTGVLNRAGLNDRLTEILADRDSRGIPFSLILIDVDDFKNINDTQGHSAGDQALVKLVGIIKERIRDTDLLCRWGGEEFVIIGTNTTVEKGSCLAEKLRETIEQTDLGLTCSFGVSEMPEEDFEGIFQAADDALYEAKHNGKNKVVIADNSAGENPGIPKP